MCYENIPYLLKKVETYPKTYEPRNICFQYLDSD